MLNQNKENGEVWYYRLNEYVASVVLRDDELSV